MPGENKKTPLFPKASHSSISNKLIITHHRDSEHFGFTCISGGTIHITFYIYVKQWSLAPFSMVIHVFVSCRDRIVKSKNPEELEELVRRLFRGISCID